MLLSFNTGSFFALFRSSLNTGSFFAYVLTSLRTYGASYAIAPSGGNTLRGYGANALCTYAVALAHG